MSSIDNDFKPEMVSREDKYDEPFHMNKNLPKDETYGKTGETNAPNMAVIDTSEIIDHTFLMPTQ